jgi:hypothetical protein
MSDRVPICTIPGLVDSIVTTDIMVAPADVAKLITRVFLSRTDNEAGDAVVASIRNATAGGGEGIAVTLASGESEGTASGSITVEASEPTYLWVASSGATSQNLRGWFEVDGAAGTTTLLTSLGYVEQFLGSDTGDDGLISNLIAAVSGEIQGWLDRAIIQEKDTVDQLDSIGDTKVYTRYFPIISIGSLTENDSALVEDTGFECKEWDKLAGCIVRISGGSPIAWAAGQRVVEVSYDHGYATVPWAIIQAATELVAFDYMQSPASSQARFGKSGQTDISGGASSYTSRTDLWEALKPRLSPYKRKWM